MCPDVFHPDVFRPVVFRPLEVEWAGHVHNQ